MKLIVLMLMALAVFAFQNCSPGFKAAVPSSLGTHNLDSTITQPLAPQKLSNRWTKFSPPLWFDDYDLTRPVLTGRHLVFLGTQDRYKRNGASYDPATGAWSALSIQGAPDLRYLNSFTAVANKMIIWGGSLTTTGAPMTNTGALFNPATNSWSPTSLTNAPIARQNHVAVGIDSRLIIWGGRVPTGFVQSGAIYNSASDTWTAMSVVNAPSSRERPMTALISSKLIVWSGYNGGTANLRTGAVYDVNSDTWTTMSTVDSPVGKVSFAFNNKMYVLNDQLNSGAIYDPALNTWTPFTTAGAPGGIYGQSVVWTGSKLIAWGGSTGEVLPYRTFYQGGGVFDPATLAWKATNLNGAPSARSYASAAWDGTRMIVWGGNNCVGSTCQSLADGASYDPAADTWTPMSASPGLSARHTFSNVMIGGKLLLWGGETSQFTPGIQGAVYDLATSKWTPTRMGPSSREGFSLTRVNNRVMMWGGYIGTRTTCLNEGFVYDPNANTWSTMSQVNAPQGRCYAISSQSAGNRGIIWGGFGYTVDPSGARVMATLQSGAAYDVTTNSWSPLPDTSDLSNRIDVALASWTDNVGRVADSDRLAVFGGYVPLPAVQVGTQSVSYPDWKMDGRGLSVFNTKENIAAVPGIPIRAFPFVFGCMDRLLVYGGRPYATQSVPTLPNQVFEDAAFYDFNRQQWTAIPASGLPPSRSRAMYFTGEDLILFGGNTVDTQLAGTEGGAVYNLATQRWLPMSNVGAPFGRYAAATVWTGAEFVVWGGVTSVPNSAGAYTTLGNGALYDPKTDTWTAISSQNAPAPRNRAITLWSGRQLIIWGGLSENGVELQDGAIFE